MSDQAHPISNPLDALRRRQLALWLIAAPLLMVAGWWALGPTPPAPSILDPPPVEAAAPPGTKLNSEVQDRAIDPAVFAINLWSPPPKAEEAVAQAPAQPAPPAPLNIQLIGIITEVEDGREILKAALYDSDDDRLLIVADGERVRDQIVRVLGGVSGVVELTDGVATRRLFLRPEVAGGAG